MTGWQIVGACLCALPFLILFGFAAAEDPEACCLTVVIMAAILGVVGIGAGLIAGWTP